MGYCNIIDVKLILAQALTSARPTVSGQQIELINVGNEIDFNRISEDVIEYYIEIADDNINGILSQQYKTPLQKCANGEWQLESDISSSSGSSGQSDQSDNGSLDSENIIELSSSCNLLKGYEILIHNDDTGDEEYHIVGSILDQFRIVTVDDIEQSYSAESTRVIRIQFPPPINQISAKLAASYIYDKHFSAQNDPNVSQYGVEQRKEAIGQLNNILNGKVILKCQQRIGDRFGDAWIDSSYAHRTPVDGYKTSDRDMSRPQ